jgi:sirohydrochlorin ferrochelatase
MAAEPCFLEFSEPSIARGFRSLAERGVRRVVVVPVLLFSAKHDQRDIPAALTAISAEHPHIAVEQSEHLGCHDAIVALSKLRYDEALAGAPRVGVADTVLVVVGRGSRDAGATAEMLQFVRLRERVTPVAQARAAFIAMADPPLEKVLDEIAASAARQVVVQPHLLFGGILVDRIAVLVARYTAAHPRIQWLVTGHLGPSELAAKAIIDRARQGVASRR